MSIEYKVFACLSADEALGALVGRGSDARIFPAVLIERTQLPAIVYQRINTNPQNYLHGDSRLENARLAISVYADSYELALTIATLVKRALLASTRLQAVWLDQADLFDFETRRRGVVADFSIWHSEEV